MASPTCYTAGREERGYHPDPVLIGRKINVLSQMLSVKNKENLEYFCQTETSFLTENSTVIKWVHFLMEDK